MGINLPYAHAIKVFSRICTQTVIYCQVYVAKFSYDAAVGLKMLKVYSTICDLYM